MTRFIGWMLGRFPSRDLRRTLVIAILCCCAIPIVQAQDEARFERHKYVAALPDVGMVTLELREEFQGKRRAELTWVFLPISSYWEFKNGRVLIYRERCYSVKNAAPDLAFVLQPLPDGSMQFEEGGVLDAKRLGLFRPCLLKPADDPHSPENRLFYKVREQEKHFSKRGSLQPLPESFSQSFMEVSALLFRDRSHEITPILQHPRISSEILEIVGNSLLNGEAGDQSHFVLPYLGAHPNLTASMMERLFALPKEPYVWRAVARNPSAPKNYYAIYLQRIREGDQLTRHMVARDPDAPREAWELAIALNEPEVLDELTRNKNAPPDLLEKISKQTELRDPVGLAANPATPATILERLSNSADKQVLWALKRNPSTPATAVERALRTLAANPDSGVRDTSVDDPRLPEELIRKLAKDPVPQIRIVLSMNKAVPLDVLEVLAKDPYRMVSERARDNIKERFPDTYQARQSEWIPLDKLNPHQNLTEDFTDAVKAGDVEKARSILAITDDPSAKPSEATIVTIILRENFEPFRQLLKETVQKGQPSTHETLVISTELKPAHIPWLIKEGLLEPKWLERLVLVGTENGRADLLAECKKDGLLGSLSPVLKNASLFTATARRNRGLVDFWLSEGAQPNEAVGSQKMTATDIAAKMYSIDILRRLDTTGKYAALLAEIAKEFPSAPNSSFLGKWSNKREGFSTVAFMLSGDGTGYMGASVMSFPVLWKPEGTDTLRMIIVGPNGPVKDQPIVLHYDSVKDVLTIDKNTTKSPISAGQDPAPFYRLQN